MLPVFCPNEKYGERRGLGEGLSKKKAESLSRRGSSGDVHPEIRCICLLRFPRIASELLTFVSSIYKVTNHPAQTPGLELNVTSIDLP